MKLERTPEEVASDRSTFSGGGLAKRMISQGVRVYEVTFWDPTPDSKLERTSRAPSCPEFIDVVDNYTLLLHQGLIEHSFLDEIEAVSSVSICRTYLLLIETDIYTNCDRGGGDSRRVNDYPQRREEFSVLIHSKRVVL